MEVIMKTNLDKYYKTNKKAESEGMWFDIVENEIGFLVKRFGGENAEPVKRAMAKYYTPHAKRIKDGTMSAEQESEIMTKVFVEACMIDWKGIEIDDKEVPFSVDNALKFFKELPDLRADLFEYATTAATFKDQLGNS